ncbi:hypothetical protein MHB64_28540 [Paenibacillus sp. FSL K6-2859]
MGGGRPLFTAAGNRSAAGRRIAEADGSLAPGGTTGAFAGAAYVCRRRW